MMNIKRNIFAVLAASVLLASCSQDEVMTDTGHDGLVPVTLSAAVGDGVQTRTVDMDDDEDATYCYVQVCDEQGNAYTDNDYATPTRLTDEDKDGTFTGNIFLKPHVTYVFLFWADNVTSTSPADLHNVTYQEESIAFADRVEQTISSVGPTVNATLQHVVAKVTLKTTTNVDASDEITVTVPTTYTAYNVNTETPITTTDDTPFVHTVTSDITGTTDGTEVFSFYALVKDETQNITLTNGTNSQQVSNVPLGPNKHTTLVGDVRNLGLTNVTFTASVVGDWGNDENVDILGYNYDANTGIYNVTSEEGLRAMAELVNGGETNINITLAKDITLTEVWTPIGNSSNQYTGTFDGNDHAISGLTIDQSGIDYVGLIGYIGNGGAVKNLTLEDVNITANPNVGAITGQNWGTIENCSVSGSVTGLSDDSFVGGIAGMHCEGTITDCHSSATVEGKAYVGGIVGAGQSEAIAGNAFITACYSTGSVTANSFYVGGVVGYNYNVILTACYATGNVKGYSDIVGGVVGDNYSTVTACYHATGSVTGSMIGIGGVIGRNAPNCTVTACYWNGTVTNGTGIGLNMSSVGEATKVEGDWTEAMNAMNKALSGTGWQYVAGSGDAPLTLQRQN